MQPQRAAKRHRLCDFARAPDMRLGTILLEAVANKTRGLVGTGPVQRIVDLAIRMERRSTNAVRLRLADMIESASA